MNKRFVGIFILSLISNLGFSVPYPFGDDFESGLANWTTNGTWGLTTASYRSPTRSATDSSGAFYTNNADASLTLASGMNLSTATRPAARFYVRHALEQDYDYALFEVSTNAGATWHTRLALTGNQGAWRRYQVALSNYFGASDVRLRFRIVTDSSIIMDGVYVDDVFVGEAPAPVVILSVAASQTQCRLEWAPSGDPAFQAYRIYRALGTNPAAGAFVEMYAVSDAAVTSWVDVPVSPKSAYTYALVVANTNELESDWSVAQALTPAGMDYPFLDNAEGGGATWSADAPWAIGTGQFFSATRAWTDSPDGEYTNNQNIALTLVAPMSLAGAVRPVLSYAHRYHVLAGDNASVEISTNNGASWIVLANYTAASTAWQRVRHDLSAYIGATQVRIRFRLSTDASGVADGWWLDDIACGEALNAVDALGPTDITSSSMRVPWVPNTNANFSHYVVVRSTSPGTDINSFHIATIYNQATNGFTDTGLTLDTVYYYRIYAVSRQGIYSPNGAEASARTLNNPIPFVENFEGVLTAWDFSGAWGVTTNESHGGTRSLTDSPAGAYSNNVDSWARTAVNLTGSTWPVLSFWDRYAIAGGDWAYVEVSSDGSGWSRVYSVNGTRTDWQQTRIDLSPWKNVSNLRIRFRLITDGGTTDDGWYVDDVRVEEHAAPSAVGLPFYERFEDGALTNWIAATWKATTNAALDGSYSVVDTEGFTYAPDLYTMLALARPLNLASTTNPVLTVWMRGQLWWRTRMRIQMSTDGGVNWSDIAGYDNDVNWTNWTRVQVGVPTWARVNGVRLRLVTWSEWGTQPDQNWYVDKLTIEEMPQAVAILTATPSLKSVDVTWTPSGIVGFESNLLVRSTSAGVTLNGTPVMGTTDPNITNWTDTGRSIGATYYYKVFTFNTNGTYTESNERSATTVPVGMPFVDGMDSLANWDATGTWGITTNTSHSGGVSLTDSPNGDYGNSSDSYLLTAVNISGSTWPVLSFWDRYAIAGGDWAYVEVSSDGSGWSRVYGVNGTRTDWRQIRIDLSPWKNASNLRIRFRLITDGSGTDDGWYVDDVRVEEHAAPPAVGLPFYERFEDGALTNWIAATWKATTNAALDGSYSVVDTEGFTYAPDLYTMLALARPLNLAATTNPVLTVWMRGQLWWRTRMRIQMSTDGGVNWSDVHGYNNDVNWTNWTRVQVGVPTWARVNGVRLRLVTWSEWGTQPDQNWYVDKLTIEEMPQAVAILTATPSLKSVDVTWTPSGIVGFESNLLVRSTSAGVTLDGTPVMGTTDPNVTNWTDTGRSIGATYYYKVFTFNTNGTYTESNERSATTVPVGMPFVDGMDSLANWDATGTWGITTNTSHSGGVSLTDSPNGDYGNSSDSYLLTAVNMTGSTWPVLSFWDRYAIAGGDWAYVEVSSDGSGWSRVYSVNGTRTDWQQTRIDLSPWKNASNLRIRFRLITDGSGTDDGWYVDDVRVEEHAAPPAVGLPFYERFEDGALTNWIAATWKATTNAALDGSYSVVDTEGFTYAPDLYTMLVLARPLNLAATTNPVLTVWMRGQLWWRTRMRIQMSTDGGVNWSDVHGYNNDVNWTNWTRVQVGVPTWARVNGVRLRLVTWSEWGTQPDQNWYVDKLTIEEMPASVLVYTPDELTTHSMRLTWMPYTNSDFEAYRIYRSTGSGVSESSLLLATITNSSLTNYTDTPLQAMTRYYYRIYLVNTNGTTVGSNETFERTRGAQLPFADGFESAQPVWTFTGTWGLQAGAGRNGGTALTDSPADYPNNNDTYALFAISLTNTTWPVLRFWDRANIAENDWGYLEISVDDGASWSRVYGIYGTQNDWCEHTIDLSPWKPYPVMWVRFRLTSDGGTTADGWYVDDLAVEEHADTPVSSVYDGFETGLGAWIDGGWTVDTNAYSGSACARDFAYGRVPPSVTRFLVYGSSINLGATTNPLLTYWYKGSLWWRTRFRAQISSDAGINWTDLHALNWDYNQGWLRFQTSLAAYTGSLIRLRFVTWSEWDTSPDIDMYIDNVGIGGPAPGAPTLAAPVMHEAVTVLRPVLAVTNAADPQSDSLTYRFEVYSDADLTNLVAQVPSVASGATTTTWQVDVNLENNAQYWWRCRASDGTNDGPWMATAIFYINETNTPPNMVAIASPPKGATLRTATGILAWYPATDPDVGDDISRYHIQVDNDPGFGSPEIDCDFEGPSPAPTGAYVTIARPLNSLTGWENPGMISNYYWRIRAQDSRYSWSPWTSGGHWFVFGVPPPDAATLTRNANGTYTLTWDIGSENWYIQASTTLTGGWQTIAGPLNLNEWTFAPDAAYTNRFYRIVGE